MQRSDDLIDPQAVRGSHVLSGKAALAEARLTRNVGTHDTVLLGQSCEEVQ
jgi:hypothetical protein